MIIRNAQVFCEDGKFRFLDVVFDSRILSVEPAQDREEVREDSAQILDGTGLFLLPGLIDIHIHGSAGVEADRTDVQGLHRMARYLASRGTTAFCPASMTLPAEELLRFAEAVRDFSCEAGEAYLAGLYLEGPFLSEQRPGSHKSAYIRRPDPALWEKIETASGHRVRFVTVAPETPGAGQLIRAAAPCSTVCIGHTVCDYDEAVSAIEAGASQLTHLFNAMPELQHRAPGPAGAAMDRAIRAELICDGIHVHPSAVRAAFRMFPGRILLISDALLCAGLADGEYVSGGQTVILKEGRATLPDGTLAGSVLTMADALRNAVRFGIPLEEAAAAASAIPAQALGIYGSRGCIRPGAEADLVLMDRDLRVRYVFLQGRQISRGVCDCGRME